MSFQQKNKNRNEHGLLVSVGLHCHQCQAPTEFHSEHELFTHNQPSVADEQIFSENKKVSSILVDTWHLTLHV